ncbi:hypothetical protein [Streptomyces albidochromogenes]|uniref:Transcriptional regulator n=1 Tax=Streptomyces albidochromogenes TaxID=329524 RepID=A0ABW6FF26_9ACTN
MTVTDLTHETQLRRALVWRDRAREDYQRESSPHRPQATTQSLTVTRRAVEQRRANTGRRHSFAQAALARAQAVRGLSVPMCAG